MTGLAALASTTLIVFAKAPVPGFAKTRLIPALGAVGAAALAEKLLHHTVSNALAAALGDVELCTTPSTQHAAFQRWSGHPRVRLTEQGGGDLGARMNRALNRALSEAPCSRPKQSANPTTSVDSTPDKQATSQPRALLMGTDAPTLDAPALRNAALALRGQDAVFVPALDGGYALVGLSRSAPTLFAGMTWSTASVMAHTRLRAAAAGLRWLEMPAVADIDEAADLVHLPVGWLPLLKAADPFHPQPPPVVTP
jgi:uncharacterized protein